MDYYLLQIFLLWIVQNKFVTALSRVEVTYEDLKSMNASCPPRDSCEQARLGYSPDLPNPYSCSCDRLCPKLGTCCIDAPQRNDLVPTLRPSCRTVDDTSASLGFYMVDKCGKFHPVWESICEDEWKGEDNIMKIAPVTSLFSSITYKNYFCFRCHERTQEYLFWNVELRSNHNNSGVAPDNSDFGVMYDQDNATWMAKGENGTSIPVNLRFRVPIGIKSLALQCQPDAISNCSNNWTDEDVRGKCHAYTAVVYIKRDGQVLKYKNAHCALCSFEAKENIFCEHFEVSTFSVKKTFSFQHLIDINHSDGNRVGKARKCEENFVWDPYGEKCRKLACAVPGYVIKDGKCAPP